MTTKVDLIRSNFAIEKYENGFFTLKNPSPLDEVLEKISSIDEDEQQTIFPYEVGGYVLWLLVR